MRRVATHLVVLAMLVTTACGSESGTPKQDEKRAAAAPAAETHQEEQNAIHLNEDAVRDLRISTATVVERTGAAELTLLGEVVADQARYAEIAPPTSGQIVRVLVEPNAPVRVGTPLAQLRSTELGRARAEVLSADARRELAQQTLERKRNLANERIVALREVQAAEAEFRAAEAQSRAAGAMLQALGVSGDGGGEDSSLFYLRSPIAGRVIDRHAVLGQYAEPQSRLFTVADLSRMWIVAQAFEREAINVAPGSTAHVTLAALPGREFDGRVTLIGGQVDADSRTLSIRIELANTERILRPGMSASARVEVAGESRTILAVPDAALQRVGTRWLAFVPRAHSEYEMRPVGRGRDLGNDVEVVSGLRAGETVVVDGAFLLKAEAEKRAGGGDEHGH
jgi:cobalt-zinc-cadmium efflux system membrane fusion protein